MGLKTDAVETATAMLGGWTDPRPYEAGTFTPREGGNPRPFEAGVSMRLVVLTAPHDFTVLKVKTANVGKVRAAVEEAQVGAQVEVDYKERNGQYECVALRVLATATR